MNTVKLNYETCELLDLFMDDDQTVEVKTGEHGRCIGYWFATYGDCYEYEDGYIEYRSIGD